MNKKPLILISFILWIFLSLNGLYFWTSIGLAITLYYTLRVIQQMGETIPIPNLMTAIASLQWILGPFIDYYSESDHYKYKMYVDEENYMSYIVPAIILFKLGLSLFPVKTNLEDLGQRVKLLLIENPRLPFVLIVLGFILPYLSGLLPATLGFVFYLLGNLKYIGVIYLLFSSDPKRWLIFWGTMVFTATISIGLGMFHDLLLWAMLTFTFVAYEMKLSMLKKTTLAIFGIFFAITIQSVKSEYRSIVWSDTYTGNKTVLFLTLAADGWRTGSIVNPSSDVDINVRLNQGWIISAIMDHIPEHEPFAEGQSISKSIYSSFVPRIIDPDKKIAGGRENFRKFTGLQIGDNTSMGISLAGEGYANFGRTGGIIFLFIWGIAIGWFWRKLDSLSSIYPTLLIWSPILFLQVIKAETELAVVLNHLVKASFLVFLLLYFIKRWYKVNL